MIESYTRVNEEQFPKSASREQQAVNRGRVTFGEVEKVANGE